MKAKKKTNHLQEEADKIEHIPEEKNNGRDGQDEPIKAKKPKKNRLLARLQKTWARITGCMRCCTSIQGERSAKERPTPSRINIEEELPIPSGTIMEEEPPTPSGTIMEEEPPTPSGIIMEEELPTSSGIIIEEELPKPSGINVEEELPTRCGINMEKELPTPSGINLEEELLERSGTNLEEELPGPDINMEDSKANLSSEEQEREDDVEEKQNIETNNEEAELGTDSFVEHEIQAEYQRLNDLIHSQENLCAQYYATQWEILAEYDHINSIDSESSKGKEKDNVKGETTSININTEREECRSEESSSKSCSLEEELHKTINNSQSGSSEYKSDSCPLEEETPEELQKSTNNAQSGSSEYKSDSCPLEEETPEELQKSTNNAQSGSSEYKSDSCPLEEETPEELQKSTNNSQSSNNHDEEPSTSDNCMEKPEQPGEGTPATVPLTLQSFTFHRTLGEGSFGEAYLARDIIRKECVAIKVIKKQYFTGRAHNFVERNILELSHESPHLIHGLAAFHTEQCVYYVMELATRGDLYNFMRKNYRLYHPTIQFIISEVICGTQFMHKKGIIHRDLKPENILLCTDGHVKIADFGLAAMDANERTKKQCVGTVEYIAPEMVRCQEHGRGVDYFAIGVILYEMYTGKVPFTGQNANDVQLAILHYTPYYPEFLTPDTVKILRGLLQKNQDYRLGVRTDVRKHAYFSNIKWEDVEARRVIPPPVMTAASVHQNMDQTLDYAEKTNRIRSKHQQIFKDFSFICPEWSQQYHLIDNIETRSWMAKLFDSRPFKKKAN